MKTELEKKRLYRKAFTLINRAQFLLREIHRKCLEDEQKNHEKAA